MKVFISWSKPKSNEVAKVLRDWLKEVLPSVEPYVSSEDTKKGERGLAKISQELQDSYFGILCITKENIKAPWLHFEAGALSKAIGNTYVCPFLFDVKETDLTEPIKQFQYTTFKKMEIAKLVETLNETCEENNRISKEHLQIIFKEKYPKLESKLKDIGNIADNKLIDLNNYFDFGDIQDSIINSDSMDIFGLGFTKTFEFLKIHLKSYPDQKIKSKLRLLLMDDTGHAINCASVRNCDDSAEYTRTFYANNFKSINEIISENPDNIECRKIDILPPYNLFIINKEDCEPRIIVHIAGWNAESIYGRPIFEIQKSENKFWYEYFIAQFDVMWKKAKEL